MPDLDLDAIAQRAATATPAPWETEGLSNAIVAPALGLCADGIRPCAVAEDVYMAADRNFIAHARTDVPMLLATIERVRAVCDQVETDDADHLARYGQHLAGSVVVVAEMVRAAIDHAPEPATAQPQTRSDLRVEQARVARVRALHARLSSCGEKQGEMADYCAECGTDWPCQTISVLDEPADLAGTGDGDEPTEESEHP